jgi:hypothetical protein
VTNRSSYTRELVYVLTGLRSKIVLLEQPIARAGNGFEAILDFGFAILD